MFLAPSSGYGSEVVPLVALWSENRQTFQSVLGKIQTTSTRSIDGIECPAAHDDATES